MCLILVRATDGVRVGSLVLARATGGAYAHTQDGPKATFGILRRGEGVCMRPYSGTRSALDYF